MRRQHNMVGYCCVQTPLRKYVDQHLRGCGM
jgi:hypothetical protein